MATFCRSIKSNRIHIISRVRRSRSNRFTQVRRNILLLLQRMITTITMRHNISTNRRPTINSRLFNRLMSRSRYAADSSDSITTIQIHCVVLQSPVRYVIEMSSRSTPHHANRPVNPTRVPIDQQATQQVPNAATQAAQYSPHHPHTPQRKPGPTKQPSKGKQQRGAKQTVR